MHETDPWRCECGHWDSEHDLPRDECMAEGCDCSQFEPLEYEPEFEAEEAA